MRIATLWASIIALCLLTILATPARATLITFDDLDHYYWLSPNHDPDNAWDEGRVNYTPLTNQYAHLGVSFGNGDLDDIARSRDSNWGAAITQYEDAVVSPSNAVQSWYDIPGSFSFRFIGDDLPDYVSFYVTAIPGQMFTTATERSGAEQTIRLGYLPTSGGPPVFTDPVAPRTKVEFFGTDIEEIFVGSFYGHRSTPVFMDNLYFGPSDAIPEPAVMPLLMIGALGFGFSIFRRRRESVVR